MSWEDSPDYGSKRLPGPLGWVFIIGGLGLVTLLVAWMNRVFG